MNTIFTNIICIIMTLLMQFSVTSSMAVEPLQAAEDFLAGFKAKDSQTISKYADNETIAMIESAEDKETVDQIYEYIFKNFEYEITDTIEKDGLAVVKVNIKTNDFSKADDMYKKAAVEYINDNLHNDKITDKKSLEGRCLDIYVDQIKKISQSDKTKDSAIYIKLKDNNHYGWDIIAADEVIKDIFGGLEEIAD